MTIKKKIIGADKIGGIHRFLDDVGLPILHL
jgi:hypothetical protein